MTFKEEHHKLVLSGMFWEFFPELSGEWEKDKDSFTKESKRLRLLRKKLKNDNSYNSEQRK